MPTKPVSRLDLPSIRAAIRELYFTVEHPPEKPWRAPAWLVELHKHNGGEAALPAEPSHAWLVSEASRNVKDRLAGIAESQLDQRHKATLIALRPKLNHPCGWPDTAGNLDPDAVILALASLESVLAELDAPSAPAADRQQEGGDEQEQVKDADGKKAEDPAVVLGKFHEQPRVRGKEKPKLTQPQYNVVQALLNAGAQGLTKDGLVKKSGHGDALGIMNRLVKSDDDWKAVLHFAGKPGGRYRIA